MYLPAIGAIITAHMFTMVTKVLTPAKSLVRVHGRGLLLSALEKESLLTKITVLPDGRFAAETKEWGSYWEPLGELGCQEAEDALNALHSAWRHYLHSDFGISQRREFCFRYFALLSVLLSSSKEPVVTYSWARGLQAALGFECFAISSATSDPEVLGAGTCTLRNPCYLLAKLKMPSVPDDPQFLSLISVAGTGKPEFFYHYRQYALSPDSPMSLLLYPTVSEMKRSASFSLLNSLINGISDAIDPWTHERAQQLSWGIVQHIIRARATSEANTFTIEFVGVGAGSGSLVSSLCRKVRALAASMGFSAKFRLWFVDLEPAAPDRFFRAKRFRSFVDSLAYIGDDYRNWLSRSQPLPTTNNLRIALISKLLNVISRFSIRRLSPEDWLSIWGKPAGQSDLEESLPARCLAPGGRGVEALMVSSSHVPLDDGRTLAQPSLSEFYRGLLMVRSRDGSVEAAEKGVFLPVRTSNPECLVTSDRRSIVSCLLEICDYIIIEDADLRPQDLVTHMTRFSLHSSAIQDMTKALKLTGNYAYVAWSKTKTTGPDLPGERIW